MNKEKYLGKKTTFRYVVFLSVFLVAGCQTVNLDFGQRLNLSGENQETPDHKNSDNNAIQILMRKSIKALENKDYKKASRGINLALKLDITNPDLQFYNGLTYHLMGTAGDTSKFQLAEQGYKQSLKFNPGYLSARYQLGLLYMDQRRYSLAQGSFAAVALHRGDSPAVLYSLASASYYARDPKTAEAALSRLMTIAPETTLQPSVLKATALSLAAMDDRTGSEKFLAAYRKVTKNNNDINTLKRRIGGWQSFYNSDVKLLLAQLNRSSNTSSEDASSEDASSEDASSEDASSEDASSEDTNNSVNSDGEADPNADPAPTPADKGFVESNMVVVDVVLIGTQEDVRDSRGVNLLSGLQLQFGDPAANTPGFTFKRSKIRDYLNSGSAESLHTVTRMIGIPAVTYSLNIANSLEANNHVLAKPSLVAQSGQTSEFFSGTEILAAAVSGGSGDSVSVQKEVGVKLAVTPEMLPNGLISLHVVAERTFLTDPSNSVVFEFRLDTTKTNINSTVTMKYDETLVLGGLSERETSKSADGVPYLMDFPMLKYLFSERTERKFERSILILITPRRPHYTRRSATDRNNGLERLTKLERDIERLENRHKDWFTPHPIFNEIMGRIQGQEFFEEFRVNDVKIQSWQKDAGSQQHIAMVRDRLLKN